MAKPGQDELHICPYTKLYGSEGRPFMNDKDLTCDENVAFLCQSDLLRHMSEKHGMTPLPSKLFPDGYAPAVANTAGGKQQTAPAVQKLR